MMNPFGTKFSGDKIAPQSDILAGTASDRIIKKDYTRMEIMACNKSRWKAANQSKD
jgi:hypothetical protein